MPCPFSRALNCQNAIYRHQDVTCHSTKATFELNVVVPQLQGASGIKADVKYDFTILNKFIGHTHAVIHQHRNKRCEPIVRAPFIQCPESGRDEWIGSLLRQSWPTELICASPFLTASVPRCKQDARKTRSAYLSRVLRFCLGRCVVVQAPEQRCKSRHQASRSCRPACILFFINTGANCVQAISNMGSAFSVPFRSLGSAGLQRHRHARTIPSRCLMSRCTAALALGTTTHDLSKNAAPLLKYAERVFSRPA